MRVSLPPLACIAVLALAACGGAESGGATTASALKGPFGLMTSDQKLKHMRSVVLPTMGRLFKTYDTKRYAEFGCATCHGEKKEDPHRALPRLALSGDGMKTLSTEKPEMMKFMAEVVTPAMATAMGEKPLDPVTHQGFGCGGCHTLQWIGPRWFHAHQRAVTTYDLSVATRDLWVATYNLSVATYNLSVAISSRWVAIHNLSVAIHNLSVAIDNLSVAISRRWVAIHNLSVATYNLSVAIHNLSVAISRRSVATYNLSVAISSRWVTTYNLSVAISRRWVATYNLSVAISSRGWPPTTSRWPYRAAGGHLQPLGGHIEPRVATYNLSVANSGRWVATYDLSVANSSRWVATYDLSVANSSRWVATHDLWVGTSNLSLARPSRSVAASNLRARAGARPRPGDAVASAADGAPPRRPRRPRPHGLAGRARRGARARGGRSRRLGGGAGPAGVPLLPARVPRRARGRARGGRRVVRRDGRADGGDPRGPAPRRARPGVPGHVRHLRGLPEEGGARRRDFGRPALQLRRGEGGRRAGEARRALPQSAHLRSGGHVEDGRRLPGAGARFLSALSSARPPSKAGQRHWLLQAVRAHEDEGAPAPATHPDRKRACPGWTERLREVLAEGLVVVPGGRLSLTDKGREAVLVEQTLYPDGVAEPKFQVHVGAVATGVAVQEDPALFERLRGLVRTTLGVEMEGVAIGDLAARFEKRAILVKAVSDHADFDKDDSFREFACRASAEVLLAFLLKHVEPGGRRGEGTGVILRSPESAGASEVRDGGDRTDEFVARVERVALLRDPGASVIRHRAAPPFAGVLEVAAKDGARVEVRVIGALDQSISEDLVTRYQTEVERRFRLQDPLLRSTLIHGGAQAPDALLRDSARRGVVLKTFAEYQGLLDFTRYLDWQTRWLEVDQVYPPWLYVEQPARVSLAGGREEQATERALATLWDLLDVQHPRFSLVLGDFGAGKTFLLHELARRMATDKHPLVPVLVEMSKLEKQRSLKALLAQHFALADMGRMDLDAFMYMLGEGRIALLFDGFDELALRVTYDRAVEHFETVLAAVHGNAKVVLTSRTQHFLTDQQVRRALAERAEQVPGYRLFQIEKFGEKQIRRFLGNLIKDPGEAEERYRLLDEVKDLLGLSENPRMLGFIARIAPEKLREAKAQSGEITAAKLYEVLVGQWLDFEHLRANPPGAPKGITRAKLRELVTRLAARFWGQTARALGIDELRDTLVVDGLDPAVVEHLVGSGSLLVRDAEGHFSFIHRSVLEWLVAEAAAREVRATGDAAALGADEMSALMADFFISLAERENADRWAYSRMSRGAEGHARKNAARILKRIEGLAGGHADEAIPVTMDLEGQDLRGQDFSGVDWQGANLAGADLRDATLAFADLRGARLEGTKLGRANLERANLSQSDLERADLSFARMQGAELGGAVGLAAGQVRGAKLVGATGVEIAGLAAVGAAPPVPGEVDAMWGVESKCNAVAWSPSGDFVASGHDDGGVRLWDVVSGQAIRTIRGHSGSVESVAFSPDGKSLASGSDDKTVGLWEVATGRSLRSFEGHKNWVRSVAFSPDGQTLASGSFDDTVGLWEVATGRSVRTFEGHTNGVSSVAFSPDGQTLASGSYDKTVRLWDVATGRTLRALKGHTYALRSVAFSPDGQTLASGSFGNTVHLWDVATGRTLRAFEGHEDSVWSVAFSPDGRTLASASEYSTVHLWDMATRGPLRAFEAHKRRVKTVAFSPDGQTLASGSHDNTVHLWDAATGRTLRAFEGHMHRVLSVAFSPDGQTLAAASDDSTVTPWDVATGRPLCAFEGHKDCVRSVAFSPDGQTLASGSYDKTARLWDVATGRTLRAFEGHKDWVWSVAFSPDGRTLASGSGDKTVRLWDVATGRTLRAFEGHKASVKSIAFSPDCQTLASGSYDETVRLWDVATGRTLRAFEGHKNGVLSVAFSPDGRTLASGSDDKTARLWDVATGRTLRAFEEHTKGVSSVTFSPDGKILGSGSDDKTVRLWEATGRTLGALEGHKNGVSSVTFSPDGQTLASASLDGTLRLWDISTARCLAILLSTPEGWAAFTPDGRYKLGGDIAGAFWHVIGLCRFEPGELDPYLPRSLRIPDDMPFRALPP